MTHCHTGILKAPTPKSSPEISLLRYSFFSSIQLICFFADIHFSLTTQERANTKLAEKRRILHCLSNDIQTLNLRYEMQCLVTESTYQLLLVNYATHLFMSERMKTHLLMIYIITISAFNQLSGQLLSRSLSRPLSQLFNKSIKSAK